MKRAEFIEKWLEALESGEYKQAKDQLRRTVGKGYEYCCLGVACQVAREIGVRKISDDVLRNELILPKSMQRLIGIDDSGDFVDAVEYRGHAYSNLTQLNDSGVKFKTIARIIREQMAKGNFEKP